VIAGSTGEGRHVKTKKKKAIKDSGRKKSRADYRLLRRSETYGGQVREAKEEGNAATSLKGTVARTRDLTEVPKESERLRNVTAFRDESNGYGSDLQKVPQ